MYVRYWARLDFVMKASHPYGIGCQCEECTDNYSPSDSFWIVPGTVTE